MTSSGPTPGWSRGRADTRLDSVVVRILGVADHRAGVTTRTDGICDLCVAGRGGGPRTIAELSTAQGAAGTEASRRLADLAWTRAFVAVRDGRPVEVTANAAQALAVYRELGLAWECGAALLLLAYASLMVGDATAAGAHASEVAAGVGDGRLACGLRVHAAQLARGAGQDGRARLLLQANKEWLAHHGGGDRAGVTHALLLAMNDDEDALTELVASDPDAAARQVALDALARLAARRGDAGRAAALVGEADTVVVPAPDFVLRVDRPSG